MDVQPELRWFMRPYLVDFLIEIHQTFGLRSETLFLTLNIVDRYVSKRIVHKRHYQLVGCAALLIAAKYEDSKDRVPTVPELAQMCCNAFDESAFPQMESHVLQTIGWQLGHPTEEAWLRIACAKSNESPRVQGIARFLQEITLFHRDFVPMAPSAIATGALLLARHVAGQSAVDIEHNLTAQAATAARLLDSLLTERLQEVSSILTKKYGSEKYGNASRLVRDHYIRTSIAAAQARTPESRSALLPAQSVDANARTSSKFEDDDSDHSCCTTPSSMSSTPSRSAMDEDEDDMPVTPLSLHSLHDPLAAAQMSIAPSSAPTRGKENAAMSASNSTSSINGKMGLTVAAAYHIVDQTSRAPLRSVSHN